MTSGTYVLRIPEWHPRRLNELLHVHWSTANKRKKADRLVIWQAVRRARAFGADRKRRVTLIIHRKPRCRGGDGDAYWKSTLDALVHCKALVDDKHQWCELAPVQYPERSAWWGTEIILEDLPHGA